MRGEPDSAPASPEWRPLARVLADHARERPDRVAITDVDHDVRITFAELAPTVEGVAAQLAARGVVHGDRVVLLIDGGIATLVVWMALWRLGAVVCPFDISQVGAASTQAAIELLRPVLILHGRRIAGSDLPVGTVPVARFGGYPAASAAAPLSPASDAQEGDAIRIAPAAGVPAAMPGADLHDVAAACCTSGSSGRTKIVLHDHESYWLNGEASARLLDLSGHDRLLEFRAFSWYSPQILSLMPMLQLGLQLHVAHQFSRTRWPGWVARHRITVAVGVPTVMNILLSEPPEGLREAAASLRLMTSSSAPLAASTLERFERLTGITVVNLYGSTEAGWICGNRPGDRAFGTVGRPAPGMEVRILGADGTPCAPGVPGEVVASGAKLALGTLESGGWLRPIRGAAFRTRDFAVQDEAGRVRLLGRMDDLIIRGGVKVSPAEVEDAVTRHEAVAEAAAVGIPDAIYGQEIVCFAALRPGHAATGESLSEHAAQLLPREKRPKAVAIIDTLPRNARGKIRRDALIARWLQPD